MKVIHRTVLEQLIAATDEDGVRGFAGRIATAVRER
jgi:hypothetical protein